MADRESQELAKLFSDAMRAPPEVTELTGESGRRVHIERNPEPGVELLVRESGTSGAEPTAMSLAVSGATARPACYPPSIPFVPDTNTTVIVLPDRTTAVYMPSALTHDDVAVPNWFEGFAAFQDVVSPLAERMRELNAAEPSAMAAGAREMVESLSPSTRERMHAVWQKWTTPSAEVRQELERTFQAVVRSMEADGWSRGESKETHVPFNLNTVEYTRGDRARAISMGALAGPGSNVMLMERQRESGGT